MGKTEKIRAKRWEKKKEIIPEENTKTGAEEHNFPDIPEEIVVDIRLRLPLKSLSRFACVSKQWHSSISDIFAERVGGKMALVEFESILTSGSVTFHSIDEESHVKRVSSPCDKKIPRSKYPTIIGSCNGLLLVGVHDDLFLWNPVTKYFKKVLTYAPLGDHFGFRIASGLCHDSSTNEYKAVMVFSPEYHFDSSAHFAVVGSFRSYSWRRVFLPCSSFDDVKSGPVVNKHLHWHVHGPYSPKIIYFNIQMNEFKEVPAPEPHMILPYRCRILGLGVLDGCLSLACCEINRDVEVLAMKEFGIKESWTTMFIISVSTFRVLGYNLEPFGYTKCGEVLMKVDIGDRGCDLIAYNPMDSSHRKILIQDHCNYANAFMYEETLVTPIDYGWEEKELRGEATYVEYFLNGSSQSMRKRRDGNWVVCIMENKDWE